MMQHSMTRVVSAQEGRVKTQTGNQKVVVTF